MAKRPKNRRETGWLGRRDMLRVFDCTDAGFAKIRATFPPDCIKNDDAGLQFYAAGCIEAWAKARFGNKADPMLVGDDSPALERYRQLKVRMAEMDVQQREQTLLPQADVHAGLLRIVAPIRHANDLLRREFGNRAGEILEEALDDAHRGIDEMFPEEAE